MPRATPPTSPGTAPTWHRGRSLHGSFGCAVMEPGWPLLGLLGILLGGRQDSPLTPHQEHAQIVWQGRGPRLQPSQVAPAQALVNCLFRVCYARGRTPDCTQVESKKYAVLHVLATRLDRHTAQHRVKAAYVCKCDTR